jgi:dihydroorotate dehydrogenase
LASSSPYRWVKPLVFKLGPERAHGLAGLWLRFLAEVFRSPRPTSPEGLSQTLWGLTFPNPVGLAAGMDKGEALAPAWFKLGFGHVEIGTITPRPQPGNPRPRLFRLIPQRSLINRMGFNNDGADVVAARLAALPKQSGVVGINVGRNKDTPNERAAADYLNAFDKLAPHADYVAINVSSPNTPGLRA